MAPDVVTEMPLSHPHAAAGVARAAAGEGGDARVPRAQEQEARKAAAAQRGGIAR
jgi:hypothetical protein